MNESPIRPQNHWAHPQRINVEVLTEGCEAGSELGGGHKHVLDDMFGVIELLNIRRSSNLQKTHGWRQHPSETPSENRAIAQRNDIFHLPENGPTMSVVVGADGKILHDWLSRLTCFVRSIGCVPVKVRLMPSAVVVVGTVIAHFARELAQHDDPIVFGEYQTFDEACAVGFTRLIVLRQINIIAPGLSEPDAFLGLLRPEIDEFRLFVKRIVDQSNVGFALNDSQLRAHQKPKGSIGPEKRFE
mmetsp:Transcript_81956/g.171510  ORF Transcript_81956/g.171510 Transcript_81956/m.171510 type:complete len:244 (+) Transcript_81956:401-1132(+)